MSRENRQDQAIMSSSTSLTSAKRAGATRASANESSVVLHEVYSSTSAGHEGSALIAWWRRARRRANPSCVAVHHRRLKHDASVCPSEQRRSAERGCKPRPSSVIQQGKWQKPKSSGDKRRPNGQAGPQESASRKNWSGNAREGGAPDERQAPWQRSGPQDPEALLDAMRNRRFQCGERTTARPSGGGPRGTCQSTRTEHAKQLGTDKNKTQVRHRPRKEKQNAQDPK